MLCINDLYHTKQKVFVQSTERLKTPTKQNKKSRNYIKLDFYKKNKTKKQKNATLCRIL